MERIIPIFLWNGRREKEEIDIRITLLGIDILGFLWYSFFDLRQLEHVLFNLFGSGSSYRAARSLYFCSPYFMAQQMETKPHNINSFCYNVFDSYKSISSGDIISIFSNIFSLVDFSKNKAFGEYIS